MRKDIDVSKILYDRDQVKEKVSDKFYITNHSIRRYRQRINKKLDKFEASMHITKCLTDEYKASHYLGKTDDPKHGVIYWFKGKDNEKEFLIPQSEFGIIRTIYRYKMTTPEMEAMEDEFNNLKKFGDTNDSKRQSSKS